MAIGTRNTYFDPFAYFRGQGETPVPRCGVSSGDLAFHGVVAVRARKGRFLGILEDGDQLAVGSTITAEVLAARVRPLLDIAVLAIALIRIGKVEVRRALGRGVVVVENRRGARGAGTDVELLSDVGE